MTYTDLLFILGVFPLSTAVSFLDSSAEYKNLILVITSLLFYSWGKSFAVCLILLSVFIDWALGLMLKKAEKNKVVRDIVLTADFVVNGGIFLVFAHNSLFSKASALSLSDKIIPLGIAFYALRGFSYVYDVYKKNIPAEKNVFCLITYMTSFHFIMAGPLVRYGEIQSQIRKRTVTGSKLNSGLNRFVYGLGKIVILAPCFEKIMLAGLNSSEITTIGCWIGMMAFFAHYYFVFTGLCDMSKGMGLMNGFDYPENYKNIEADGLFTGMVRGFNCTVVRFFEQVLGCGKKRNIVLTIVGALLCGAALSFWYSAKLNFVIVGICAAALCLVETLVTGKYLKKLPAVLKYIYMGAFALVIFGGIYFDSVYGYKKWLLGLLGVDTKYSLGVAEKNAVAKNIVLIAVALVIVLPCLKRLVLSAVEKIENHSPRAYGILRICQTVLTSAVFLTCICTLVVQAA